MMFSGFFGGRSARKIAYATALVGVLLVTGCDSPEQKVQNHYNNGEQFLKDGNLIKAGLEFRNSIQINEKFVPALYGLAQVEERKGNLGRARGLLKRVLDLDPKNYKASIKYGKFMLVAGQLDKALALSDTVMALDGTTAEALSFRAAVLYKLDDPKAAIVAANKALAVDPANVDAITVLAAERIAAKDFKGAIAYLDRGLKLNKKNVTLQLIKAQALDTINKTDQAEAVLQQLVKFYPKARGFKTALVRLYLRHKRVDDAEREIRSIAKGAPDDLQANLDVVRFLNSLKGVKAASKELETLIGRGGKNTFSYQLALARLRFASGKRGEAKKILLGVIDGKSSDENKLAAKNRLAELLIADKKPGQAAKIVAEVLASDAQNTDALITRAVMRIRKEKLDDAISDLRTVLKGDPENVRALLLLSRAHELNGSVELADDRMGGAFQASKFSPRVGLVYARFLVKNGALARAEDALIKVLRKSPRNIATLRALAQVRISRQNWLGAQEVADILTKLGDDKSVIGQIKGIALEGQQKITQSIAAFEQAQAATPNALRPMVALVRAYIRNGELKRAENFVQAVLNASDKNVFAKVLLAQLRALGGKYVLAEATFKEAVAESPGNVVGYTALASYYLGRKEFDKAKETVAAGLGKLPGNVSLGLLRANLLERDQNFAAALQEYEKLYKKRPNSEVIINNLASMLTEYRTDKASIKRAYEMAKRFKNSKIPYFKDTLGWIQYRMGNAGEAVSLLKQVVKQAPNVAVFRYHLGTALLADKQDSSATQELEQALKLSNKRPLVQDADIRKTLNRLRAAAAAQQPANQQPTNQQPAKAQN